MGSRHHRGLVPENICDGLQQQPPLASDDDDTDTRFLEVCSDGDVEDLVQLFEELANAGETLGPEDLNCVDPSGRVSQKMMKDYFNLHARAKEPLEVYL